MGREIRRVPKNWKHPKYIRKSWSPTKGDVVEEEFKPLYQEDYKKAVKEYTKELKEWFKGQKNWSNGFYVDYDGKKLTKKECFKKWLIQIEEDRKRDNFGESYRAEEKMRYLSENCSYEDIAGGVPSMLNPDDYMPFGRWYQVFETVSEGTPITPPFETKKELVEWLSNNKDFWEKEWTKEQAEAMLEIGYAPSMVVSNGKIYNSQESLTELNA